jgi:hypothetical protein
MNGLKVGEQETPCVRFLFEVACSRILNPKETKTKEKNISTRTPTLTRLQTQGS